MGIDHNQEDEPFFTIPQIGYIGAIAVIGFVLGGAAGKIREAMESKEKNKITCPAEATISESKKEITRDTEHNSQ